ncbi:MAG: FAD-dependent oxidoreductase [Alphaproteobacteria bacterium]
MSKLGSEENPLRVAVVGSGPSGFYAAEALHRSDVAVRVVLIDRLPAPYGLVRNGVAPDHPKLKQAIATYDKIAREPDIAFLGNIMVGKDVAVEELRETHHAVLFCCGAETDRRLGIAGEDLPGSHTATEFVGWYNAHPGYCDRAFDLSHEVAVIIGQGNVAADVCRILAKTVDELKHTDIAEHALAALAQSRVREVYVVGRRGPAQAKFTPKELRELAELEDCDPVVDPADLELNPESEEELTERTSFANKKNVEIFRTWVERPPAAGKSRRIYFRFLQSPIELLGKDRLEKVVLERNRLEGEPFGQAARGTGETMELACGILFRSIGYRGVPIPGVPFDEKRGVFPNADGRILDGKEAVPGLYAAGWIKRGPTGVIGTNRADAVATVKALLEDLPSLDQAAKPGAEALLPLLAERGVRAVSYDDWLKIDAAEVERGAPKGKPREKFTEVNEMLAVLG